MRRSILPTSAGMVALAALALAGCKPSQSADDPRTETQLVRITTVEPAQPTTRSFTGIVDARVQSDLGFRVSGKVVERLVDIGQTVRAGQPLMRIDRTDLAHAVTAQAGNVAAARARAVQTAADEARYRGLVASGAVSKSTYDQAKAAADSARALLSAARAQARIAENEDDYSVLVADADGVVVETLAEPGQVVTAGQTVLRLAHAGPREAAVDLPETLRPAIGSTAKASLYGDDGPPAKAYLRQLSDAADPLTRTFEARYVLEGPLASAPLGATVTVSLPIKATADRSEVPLGAIDDEGFGPGVWLLDRASSSVAFRRVAIDRLGNEDVVLGSGVRPGDIIVALGGHLLHQGERVRVAGDQAAAE